MMSYIKKITIVLVIANITFVSAQKILTKEEAIQQALEHNYGIKIAKNNVEVAKNNASVLNTNHLPTVSTSAVPTIIIVIKILYVKMVLLLVKLVQRQKVITHL